MRRIFPQLTAPQPPLLTTEEKERIIGSLNNTNNRDRYLDAFNAVIDIAQSGIGGALFAIAQEALSMWGNTENSGDETYKTSGNETYNISGNMDDERISNPEVNALLIKAGALGLASLALSVVSSTIRNKFFTPEKIASSIKSTLNQLRPATLQQNLAICQNEEGNLADLRGPGSNFCANLLAQNNLHLSYSIAGLITAGSQIDENDKYLLFASSRILAGFIIDKMVYNLVNCTESKPLLSSRFLNEFTPQEKIDLQQALAAEIPKHTNCSKHMRDLIVGASVSMTFVGIVHEMPHPDIEETSLQYRMNNDAANFIAASATVNALRLMVKYLEECRHKARGVAPIPLVDPDAINPMLNNPVPPAQPEIELGNLTNAQNSLSAEAEVTIVATIPLVPPAQPDIELGNLTNAQNSLSAGAEVTIVEQFTAPAIPELDLVNLENEQNPPATSARLVDVQSRSPSRQSSTNDLSRK